MRWKPVLKASYVCFCISVVYKPHDQSKSSVGGTEKLLGPEQFVFCPYNLMIQIIIIGGFMRIFNAFINYIIA